MNAILEQYLRAYVNYQQTNWVDLFCLAEFAYNNGKSESSRFSPFYANYEYHPDFSIRLNPLSTGEIPAGRISAEKFSAREIPARRAYVEQLQALHEVLKSELKYAEVTYTAAANKKRLVALQLAQGDKVWLFRCDIRMERLSAKMD